MRAWLADRLDRLSYWFEGRAQDIGDLSWRVRPRGRAVGPLSEIITATLHHRAHKLAEDTTRNNALLRSLKVGK